MKLGAKTVLLILLCGTMISTSWAQETTRHLEDAGQFSKHLTPGLVDRWIIQGEVGETVIAHVSTRDFDPVLELAQGSNEEATVLFTVDDKGSESRFATRLPATGEYAIRVHAFNFKGGGNYSLQVQRFEATPVKIGETNVSTFNREGRGYHWFEAKKDQVLTIDLIGTSSHSWELLDGKGRRVDHWEGAVAIEEEGTYSLIITGNPASRYELLIREADQQELSTEQALDGQLKPREMDIWNFGGSPGQFRLITVEQQGQLKARLIHAARDVENDERIAERSNLPEINFLPVASKGNMLRFAALLGRAGPYQLQLMAESDASYSLEMRDPARPIEKGEKPAGTLPVGGSDFYRFEAMTGQLISARLKSSRFDPVLTLYNHRGDMISQNDDGLGGLGSLITRMTVEEGEFILQVTSLGNGGGGGYELELREQKLNELEIGGRATGELVANSTDFWAFTGKEDQTVLLSARSNACNPVISLYSPDGVRLASDDDSGVGTDSLLAAKLPKTGRYTIRVESQRGTGEYTLRLIDGD